MRQASCGERSLCDSATVELSQLPGWSNANVDVELAAASQSPVTQHIRRIQSERRKMREEIKNHHLIKNCCAPFAPSLCCAHCSLFYAIFIYSRHDSHNNLKRHSAHQTHRKERREQEKSETKWASINHGEVDRKQEPEKNAAETSAWATNNTAEECTSNDI